MRAARLCGVGLGMSMVLAASGCAPADDPPPLDAPVASAPAEELTVLGQADSAAAAIDASSALFERSPVVVLTDAAHRLPAASVGVALGVPVLDVASDPDALDAELDRLSAKSVLLLGNPPEGALLDGITVVAAQSTPKGLDRAVGIAFEPHTMAGDESTAEAVAGLNPESHRLLLPDEDAPADGAAHGASRLPRLLPSEPAAGLVALATDEPAGILSLATARAAGADVLVMPADGTNPQTSSKAIEFLAERRDASVLALGPRFAAERGLDWKIASSKTGLQLPDGGQLLFPRHLMVAIYGTPGTPSLGVLGERDLAGSIDRAQRHARAYERLTPKPVLPAFELIATVASGSKGNDGNYSNELSPTQMLEWAKAAGTAGMYAILDLQPGRTDFVTQAKLYEEVLKLPWVGLALDPEWRLKPHERHLVHIGSVGSAEVNAVQDYLADLVRRNALPPKLLVLHQFRTDMIEDRAGVDVDRPEVSVLIHADGQGGQPQKQATWRRLHADAPDVAWGWKNFYDEDAPMLTPEQTMMVEPVPDLVTYQ